MRTNGTNKKAFTLIELLVVISIIALLLSILMPSLQRVKAQALKTVCSSNLHQLAIATIAYGAGNDDKIQSVGRLHETHPVVWYFYGGTPERYFNMFEALGSYVGEENDSVWECPSASRWRQANINVMLNNWTGYVWSTYMNFAGARFWYGQYSQPGQVYIPTPARLSKAKSGAVLFQDETRNRDNAPYGQGIIVNHNRRAKKATPHPQSFKVVFDEADVDGANLGFVDGSVSWTQGSDLIYIGYDHPGGWGGNTLSVKP